ncbi:hypothetical protein MRS44_016555 [Fusarium solani]|uniref:uncharacterized protein n=1 Tax=Fusarium solani TaxID=169388 RepID=UPI0032C3F9BB|nr:hypothetical protein MRS44_016555 [Fusarium solani]
MKFTLVTILATLAVTGTALPTEADFSAGKFSLRTSQKKAACDRKCYEQCYLDWCITPDPFGNLSCILACQDICGCI